MKSCWAYLPLLSDNELIEACQVTLSDYAHAHGLGPVTFVMETARRSVHWRSRELGALLGRLAKNDVMLTPEFIRLAAPPAQIFQVLEAIVRRGASLHVTGARLVVDGTTQSKLRADTFALAAQIESLWTSENTIEGIRRAQALNPLTGGPRGNAGFLKLAAREQEVRQYVAQGLSKRQIAAALGVAYNTVNKYLRLKEMALTAK